MEALLSAAAIADNGSVHYRERLLPLLICGNEQSTFASTLPAARLLRALDKVQRSASRLRPVLARFDRERSGTVSAQTFQAAIKRLGVVGIEESCALRARFEEEGRIPYEILFSVAFEAFEALKTGVPEGVSPQLVATWHAIGAALMRGTPDLWERLLQADPERSGLITRKTVVDLIAASGILTPPADSSSSSSTTAGGPLAVSETNEAANHIHALATAVVTLRKSLQRAQQACNSAGISVDWGADGPSIEPAAVLDHVRSLEQILANRESRAAEAEARAKALEEQVASLRSRQHDDGTSQMRNAALTMMLQETTALDTEDLFDREDDAWMVPIPTVDDAFSRQVVPMQPREPSLSIFRTPRGKGGETSAAHMNSAQRLIGATTQQSELMKQLISAESRWA